MRSRVLYPRAMLRLSFCDHPFTGLTTRVFETFEYTFSLFNLVVLISTDD